MDAFEMLDMGFYHKAEFFFKSQNRHLQASRCPYCGALMLPYIVVCQYCQQLMPQSDDL